MSLRPIKSLGQNFLIDKNIAIKTVNALKITENDFVIEIGPGEGSLTGLILKQTKKLAVIEIDRRAVDLLKDKYPDLNVIYSDILKVDFDAVLEFGKNYNIKVIGNIPYNISSEIFFKLFEYSSQISKSILTIQKEVAQRLSAKQKSKDYGILTIAMALCGKSEILFDVAPDCFFPKPNVISSVIEFDFNKNNFDSKLFKDIMKLVRAGFNQRRKKLSNSIASYVGTCSNPKQIYEELKNHEKFAGFLHKRAEELTEVDFMELYNFIKSINEKAKGIINENV